MYQERMSLGLISPLEILIIVSTSYFLLDETTLRGKNFKYQPAELSSLDLSETDSSRNKLRRRSAEAHGISLYQYSKGRDIFQNTPSISHATVCITILRPTIPTSGKLVSFDISKNERSHRACLGESSAHLQKRYGARREHDLRCDGCGAHAG